jgi:protein phosphatase
VKNGIDENFCSQCGGDLSQSSPAYLGYVIKESDDPDQLAADVQLMREGLDDPALYLPEKSFQERVAGTVRHYVAIPAPPATTLADRKPPEELPTVLSWGAMLARGLAALHRQQIAIDGVKPSLICVGEGRAGWCDLSGCRLQASQRALVSDVRQLAGLLFYLATGQQQYETVPDWPETVRSLFERALTTADQVPSAQEMAEGMADALETLRRPASVDFRLGRRTDVGMQRQLNEDSMLTVELVWNNRSQSQPVNVSVVADGMGGHAAGEVASGLAIQAIAREASRGLLVPTTGAGGDIPAYEAWLKEAVQAANTAVHERVRASGNDMGTTIVAALVVADVAHVAHVGDSRAYRVNAQAIEQITVDHSLVERLVATGQITREEAKYHPQRNVIYRTIGDKAKVEVDMHQVQLRPGDRLLLCSDGLSGMVDDEEIQRLVLLHEAPQAACDALVQAANAAGGDDNVTAIIVEVIAL